MRPADKTSKLPERMERASAPKRPPHFKRVAIVLVVTVCVLGAIFSWLGTRGGRMYDGPPPQDALAASSSPVHVAPAQAAETLQRGATIHQLKCAGCHAEGERLIGPSYQEIAARYRERASEQAGGQSISASETQVLSAIAAAVNHPVPGWAAYPLGPALQPLSAADRTAVAYWILHRPNK